MEEKQQRYDGSTEFGGILRYRISFQRLAHSRFSLMQYRYGEEHSVAAYVNASLMYIRKDGYSFQRVSSRIGHIALYESIY
jgi:hypothetical protein